MESFFLTTAAISVVASVIKLIKKDSWWIRFFDFPQWQVVIIGYLALGGLLLTWDFSITWHIIAISVLLVVLIYETTIVYPYTYFAPHESKKAHNTREENEVSLMISNVYMYNNCYDRCLDLIERKDADIVILVETNLKWEEKMRRLEHRYEFRIKYPLDNTYGMLLYSKLELIAPEVKFLIEEDVPSIHTYVKLRNGKRIKLYAVHPKPPSPTQNETSTERDAELYILAKEIEHVSAPVIVAGDLNDVAWSRSTRIFQRISGLLDPRKGRGFFNTFHVKYPVFRWPLDHVFHSGEFCLIHLERLPDIGSDHFPMFIHLAYISDKEDEPLEEPADEGDRKEALEKISAAL
ncbi:endonuclease/exonuclease/phosphatase family protein [Fulvivirga imtechensis]|uniref:endonuclease/exonuclease/phosphatase family protein n=1 Tax=Fulvivirga imtechensis TaxID=881893 RepID=UPI0002EC4124|nr:endonuclease/exonuclease/phosphatase family protein [Fulvivirga imtechensis]